jgi:hypothetical protein
MVKVDSFDVGHHVLLLKSPDAVTSSRVVRLSEAWGSAVMVRLLPDAEMCRSKGHSPWPLLQHLLLMWVEE